MRRTRFATRLITLGMAAALVSACAAGDESDDPSPGDPTQSATGDVDPPVDLPDSPVGDQARWALDQLGADDGPSAEESAEHFSAGFLTAVPVDEITAIFDRLRDQGGWTPVDVDADGADAVVRLHDGSGEPWRMVLAVDADGAIGELYIQPVVGGPRQPATTWAEVREQLTEFDAEVSLLAARVTADGRCEPVSELDADEPRPLASIFKLYVLGAAAEAVEEGWATWSQPLTVTDDVRSLASGKLQDEPTGTQVSLSQTAAGMIAISDNTAADMITGLLGRDAVEAAAEAMGHSDPKRNDPFLTTREFFTIGWESVELREQWADADTAADRLAIAEALPGGVLTVTGSQVDDPAWSDGIDWFGTTEDICAAYVALHEGEATEPNTAMLRTILGHNRGVTISSATWPYVAFKGGSAPGVLTGSWFGERADGERYFFGMQAAATDEDAMARRDDFFALAEDAFVLLSGDSP